MNVGFISLGCSKNLVDTEIAIGIFKNKKYNIVNDPKQADIIVINTSFHIIFIFYNINIIAHVFLQFNDFIRQTTNLRKLFYNSKKYVKIYLEEN